MSGWMDDLQTEETASVCKISCGEIPPPKQYQTIEEAAAAFIC